MRQLTQNSQLNATLGIIAAHAQVTSFGVPSPKILNLGSDFNMASHVSRCCNAMVHFDLELPYCAGCGEYCQPVVFDGLA